MELKTVIPWAILLGVYGLLVYVLGPANYNFAAMAPGILILGSVVIGINQIRKYIKFRKLTRQVKSAV